jgi:hypothetical protein
MADLPVSPGAQESTREHGLITETGAGRAEVKLHVCGLVAEQANRRGSWVVAAATLSGTARQRTYGRLAVDLARDAAPVAAWGVPDSRNLFATRIGCQAYQPIYGFDLATLCLRRTRCG